MSMVPGFIRSLALVGGPLPQGGGSDPVGEFLLRIGTGPSPPLPKTGERIMSKKRPAGKSPASRHVDWKALEIVHPDAAGIDVGGSEHWVAIRPDRDAEPVRRFDCFTADLRAMARWLVDKGVRSVAMQSTGVYWMPVFEVLEQSGLEVSSERPPHQEPARAQERCAGV